MVITQDSFDALLEWLDPDRVKAAERYEVIRRGLIRIFVSHGLADAEHYADETIDRVIKRLPDIRAGYVDDPAKYFRAVARNIIREASRRREIATDVLPECVSHKAVDSDLAECMRKCLKSLPADKRELILDYHAYEGHDKIVSHNEMASERSITVGALRTRAHHVRAGLEDCVLKCLAAYRNKTAGDSHNSRGIDKERGS